MASSRGTKVLKLLFDADNRQALKRVAGLESSLEEADRTAREAKDSIQGVGEGVSESTADADKAMKKLGITSATEARRQIGRLEQAVDTVKQAAKEGRATQEDVARAQDRLADKTKRWARLTERQVEKAWVRPLRKAQQRLDGFRNGLSRVGRIAAGIGAAGAAGGAGLALVNQRALEVDQAARVSGMSVERIQELGFAARSYGIDIEDLGDKLKDVNEKFNEYIETLDATGEGAGALTEFFDIIAPKIGLTVEEFRKLDSAERLQKFVEALEASGRTLEEGSTFYLEGVVSDATKLLTLFENQGEELERLTQRFRELGGGLTEGDIQRAQEAREAVVEVGNAFDRLGSSILEAGFGDAFENASAALVDFLGKLDSAVKKTESFLRKSDSVFALAFRGSTIGEAFGYERSAADMDKIREIRGYATGGIDIRGPGTGTSDSILARISNGESVITAAATSFWGPDFMNAVNNMAMPPEFGAIPSALAEAGGPSRGPMVALPIQGPDGVYEGQFDPDTAERLERDMRKRAKTKSIRSPAFTRRRYGQ